MDWTKKFPNDSAVTCLVALQIKNVLRSQTAIHIWAASVSESVGKGPIPFTENDSMKCMGT
jgi:hypothetical protein